jgi:hypothetical protein
LFLIKTAVFLVKTPIISPNFGVNQNFSPMCLWGKVNPMSKLTSDNNDCQKSLKNGEKDFLLHVPMNSRQT